MTSGLLLMAYGTPQQPEELEAYYTDIRRGRPPTAELLADLRRRYDAIGGLSPLAALTRAQAAAVQSALDERHGAGRWQVEVGLKHAAPRIEDGMAALAGAGVELVVGLVLAPHSSSGSVGQYHDRARAAAGAGGVAYEAVDRWGTAPELIDLLAGRCRQALDSLPAPTGTGRHHLLFTAHSLPLRTVQADADAGRSPSYEEQLRATGAAVAGLLALEQAGWSVAFQSAGRTPDPWLGPDILDAIRALAAQGVDGVAVCPAGFTADHLEVLYDIDIEARAVAADAGVALTRAGSLNDDPAFVALLARLASEAAAGATTGDGTGGGAT